MKTRTARTAIAGAAMAALSATPAAAQILIVNSDFNTGASGWTLVGGGSFDATMDSDFTPTSGSVRGLASIPGGMSVATGADQCVSGLVGGTSYSYRADILLHSAPSGGSARLSVYWHGDDACTDFLGFLTTASSVSSIGSGRAARG